MCRLSLNAGKIEHWHPLNVHQVYDKIRLCYKYVITIKTSFTLFMIFINIGMLREDLYKLHNYFENISNKGLLEAQIGHIII